MTNVYIEIVEENEVKELAFEDIDLTNPLTRLSIIEALYPEGE